MKTTLILLLSVLFSLQLSGQTFKKFKETNFYFVASKKVLKGYKTPNAYIKKGDTILIIEKIDLDNFLGLFEKVPQSFDSLFATCQWIGYKHSTTDDFDKVLKQTNYKAHTEIGSISITEKEGNIVWDLVNSNYVIGEPNCYTSIIFKAKNSQGDHTKVENLEYLQVKGKHCDI